MDNAVNGKTMENLRKRINVKLVSNKRGYLKQTSKLNYMSQNIFDSNLLAICKSKVTLTLNKLPCVGLCILDLSKILMYEFCYDHIKSKYENNSVLLFTDTDSLMYEIKTVDSYMV